MKNTLKQTLSVLLVLALLCAIAPAYTLPAVASETDVAINADNFPDGTFREYVTQFDTDGDGVLQAAEIAEVTEMGCDYMAITSLKGIAYFTALKWLSCNGNQLTALDVSWNTALTSLFCGGNQLTALDVSRNTALKKLSCSGNQLTALDVSKNTALDWLSCGGNLLTALDVSRNASLEWLNCCDNRLTALDVSKNTALDWLSCGVNQLTALDVSKNTALTELDCGGNHLTALDVSRNTALTELGCDGNQLTALDVSKNTELTYLSCGGNQLTALDVSKNTALTYLSCGGNQLTALDVSKNTELTSLGCYSNQLTALDVSKNTELTSLGCYYNQIKTLDISNNPTLEDFLVHGIRDTDILDYCYYHDEDYEKAFAFDKTTEVLLSDGTVFHDCPFEDVMPGKYYYNPVIWAINHEPQITSGTDATHFSPNNTCTREQIVTFLWKAKGAPEPTATENPFTDVKPGKYYEKAVLWAVENKITGGVGDGKFGVGQPCTREQAMTFLWKACGAPEPKSDNNPFNDVKSSKYYYKAVLWAVENGVTSGKSANTFGVGQSCTRAQIVTFLYKAVKE